MGAVGLVTGIGHPEKGLDEITGAIKFQDPAIPGLRTVDIPGAINGEVKHPGIGDDLLTGCPITPHHAPAI